SGKQRQRTCVEIKARSQNKTDFASEVLNFPVRFRALSEPHVFYNFVRSRKRHKNPTTFFDAIPIADRLIAIESENCSCRILRIFNHFGYCAIGKLHEIHLRSWLALEVLS